MLTGDQPRCRGWETHLLQRVFCITGIPVFCGVSPHRRNYTNELVRNIMALCGFQTKQGIHNLCIGDDWGKGISFKNALLYHRTGQA